MSTRASDRRAGGFSLAEVLIALAVLGVAGITATALLAHLTEANVDGRSDVTGHATAAAVIESLLTHDYDELVEGTQTGTSVDGVGWTLTVSEESTGLRRLRVDAVDGDRTVRLETLVADR